YGINHQNSAISEISPINTLDDLYNFREKSIAMKIDVEGFEYEVLNGALSFLKNNKIFLQIEVRYENYEKIKNYLYDIGYHIIEDKPPKTAGGYTDCFFKNY
ncbi:FkbM family methyltransferase, partial [Pelagibacteraceae bacterium]|nr:FkbM family methyltransferase [Pelagibacteraceae bacterium]